MKKLVLVLGVFAACTPKKDTAQSVETATSVTTTPVRDTVKVEKKITVETDTVKKTGNAPKRP
jgi:hypothetical protein